ncbi:hypothetical protein [Modicisalibacter tunisiensis]|uniref:EF-hand domain-containing protein n=1 Tax=Modicisalibacter tunisiensis TaxID=390637 RepID=A0ABS7WZH4_9GAMM|nr:hypothetical protein [Modicisalibacter tunisiensis]MBZ9567593.1 hypothetical protein [Modicisalibacter tunisiensis]
MRKELITGILIALTSTGAFASFTSQDSDGNGKISRDEFYGSAADVGTYSDWDLNDDGLLDENEFGELDVDWDYDTWDANDDDYVDSGEFYDGIYDTYDVNDDGEWDDSEWDDADEDGVFDM